MNQPIGKNTADTRMADLERRLADLERQMRSVPSRFPVGAVSDGQSIRMTIAQANAFAAEDVVYNFGGVWALARADNAAGTAKYSGVVESADGSSFVVVFSGRIELALTPGVTYYLSDSVSGQLVQRASVTQYEPIIPVVRCISATECLVLPQRDSGSDLATLTAGDETNGGGELVVNIGDSGSAFYVTADETDGVVISIDEDNAVQVHPDGHITIDQPEVALNITAGVVTLDYGSGNTVVIDPGHFVGTGRAVRLRELNICDEDNVAKKILALCSDYYDP